MSLFDKVTGSRFYTWGDKLGDLIIISLLWLAFSLPVVTIGASTAALYYATTRRFLHSSNTPGKDFLRSFRQNLRQGTLITLIYLVYCALLAFDIYAARNGINGVALPNFYEQIAYALTLPIVFTLPFVFAYLSRFNDSIKKTMKHSFMLCASHPVHAVGIMLIVLISAVLMAFVPLILLVPASCAYLCSRFIERDFQKALGIDPDAEFEDRDAEEDTQEESSVSTTDRIL
jgi:uncharacterized membrane protein YesL